MLPSSREIAFHTAISRMSLAEDDSSLHIIDNECHLHIINLAELKITKSTSLSHLYDHMLFDYYKRPFAIGKSLAYVSFSQKGAEHIIDIRSKILPIHTLHYNDNEVVTKAELSEHDALLITGNERGRSYIVSTQDGTLQAELPVTSDTISAVAISEEFHLAARASFSKDLVVYKTNSFSILFEQKLETVIEMMAILDSQYLLAILRNGKLVKIDLYRQKIIKEVSLDHSLWPSVLSISHSKKFLYIGTRESILFAVHIETMDILYQVKLPYQGITTLARGKRYFMIGFKTGEVLFYNHREFEEEFINYIKLRQIKEAALLFQKNIFLMSHRETKKIYECWLEEKETIMNLLSRGEIAQAQALADPYLFHPKCKLEFNEIEMLQPDLMALHRYIRSLSFAAAYDLVTSKPELKQSSLYTHMESLWNKNLQKAQILLSRDPQHNKEQAKDTLRLFLDVEVKKPIIENMLKRSGIFTLAETSVKEKNFAFYFKLVGQNAFLELTPLYQKVLQVAERVQHETLKYIEEKNYQQSLILADILHQFRPYQNQANRLREVSKALMILEYQITHHMLMEAVKTQDQFQLQSNYELIQTLEEMKKQFQEEQLILLNKKEYAKVFANVAPYMEIATCKQNVANIMRKLYIEQFKDAVLSQNQAIDWEKSFVNYFHYFAKDKLLVEFAKTYQKLEALQHIIVSKPPTENPKYVKTLLSKQNEAVINKS